MNGAIAARGAQRRASARLRAGLILSLLVHAFILSLQFGMPGLGLPGLDLPWHARRAEPPSLSVVLSLSPAEPAPATASLPPVPPPPVAPAGAARTEGGLRMVPEYQPPASAAPARRLPATKNARRAAPPPRAPSQRKLIASFDAPDAKFAVAPPDPDLPSRQAAAEGDDAAQAAPVMEQAAPAPEPPISSLPPEPPAPEPDHAALAREEAKRQAARAAQEQERTAAEAARANAAMQARRQAEQDAQRQAALAADMERQAQAARQQALAQERQAQAEQERQRLEQERRQLAAMEQQRLELEKERLAAIEKAREEERQAREREARLRQEQEEQQRELARRQEAERQAAMARQQEAARRQAEQAAQQRERERESMRAAQDAAQDAGAAAARDAAPLPRAMTGGLAGGLAARALEQARNPDLLRASPPAPETAPAASNAEAPRRRSVFGSIDRDVGLKMYIDSWRQKIERNGNLNYAQSSRDKARGDPVVTVAIRSDGTIEDIVIHRGSGRPELDEAVRRIARINARYAAFPPALARKYDVIEIRRIWSFDDSLRLLEELR